MTDGQRSWLRSQLETADHSGWPPAAWQDPPALLVYATDALLAYYLAPDGRVYELDLDRAAQTLDEVTDPARVREVHERAHAAWPALLLA
jgi:hypothetical protein